MKLSCEISKQRPKYLASQFVLKKLKNYIGKDNILLMKENKTRN